jgi:hypothetical protein
MRSHAKRRRSDICSPCHRSVHWDALTGYERADGVAPDVVTDSVHYVRYNSGHLVVAPDVPTTTDRECKNVSSRRELRSRKGDMPEMFSRTLDVLGVTAGGLVLGLVLRRARWYHQQVTGMSPPVARFWRWRMVGMACAAGVSICFGLYGTFRGSGITDWLLIPGVAATWGYLIALVRTSNLEYAIGSSGGRASPPRAQREPTLTSTPDRLADENPPE